MLERQKRLNFLAYWKCRLLLLITVLYLVRQLILYSHSVWVTNTVCSLFRYFFIILFAAYSVYGQIVFAKNSSDEFHRHCSICCLYSFLDEFLFFLSFFKECTHPKPHVLYSVPLELSQLVLTLDCISGRKLSLFCPSNIVCYRL